MTPKASLDIPREKIAEFCKKNRIKKLSIFGPTSDIDVLVEFEPEACVGLIGLAGMEIEPSKIAGKKVDLNTPGFLSKYFRDKVLTEAVVEYDAA